MLTRALTAALAAATIAGAMPALAQSASDDARFRAAQDRFDREYQIFRQEADRYAAARSRYGYNNAPPPPPVYRQDGYYQDDDRYDPNYDAARYYRRGSSYTVLSSDDRVYAGSDGRYYCRRSDGTTGLIIGAAGGGLIGNALSGYHSRTLGTLLGAAAGAVAGKAIDQNNSEVRCQ